MLFVCDPFGNPISWTRLIELMFESIATKFVSILVQATHRRTNINNYTNSWPFSISWIQPLEQRQSSVCAKMFHSKLFLALVVPVISVRVERSHLVPAGMDDVPISERESVRHWLGDDKAYLYFSNYQSLKMQSKDLTLPQWREAVEMSGDNIDVAYLYFSNLVSLAGDIPLSGWRSTVQYYGSGSGSFIQGDHITRAYLYYSNWLSLPVSVRPNIDAWDLEVKRSGGDVNKAYLQFSAWCSSLSENGLRFQQSFDWPFNTEWRKYYFQIHIALKAWLINTEIHLNSFRFLMSFYFINYISLINWCL